MNWPDFIFGIFGGCLVGVAVGWLLGHQTGIVETEVRWTNAVARKEDSDRQERAR